MSWSRGVVKSWCSPGLCCVTCTAAPPSGARPLTSWGGKRGSHHQLIKAPGVTDLTLSELFWLPDSILSFNYYTYHAKCGSVGSACSKYGLLILIIWQSVSDQEIIFTRLELFCLFWNIKAFGSSLFSLFCLFNVKTVQNSENSAGCACGLPNASK